MPDEPGSAREIHEGKFLAFVLPVFGGYLGAVSLVPGVPVALPHHVAEACRGSWFPGGFCIPAPVLARRCVSGSLGHAV